MTSQDLGTDTESMLNAKFIHPYEPRSTSHVGLWQENGWSFNIYSIHHQTRRAASPEIIECAKSLTRDRLLRGAPHPASHQLGFIILHQALGSDYILLCWWIDTNMICQHLFAAKPREARYHDFSVSAAAICVFEFEVIAIERRLWIEHVLSSGGSVAAYIHAPRSGDSPLEVVVDLDANTRK
ncbi:MAG: hypothetical protein DMG88_19170 [Acidobacteria bacterium]|nr:MAG: hypothetical protein DMG88_19170 [Acidobacteriota bacterium]